MITKKEINTLGMAAMLHFADLGYVKVNIHFSGAGDSGDIDDPEFYKKDEQDSDISHTEMGKRRSEIDSTILDNFKSHVSDILNNIEDWWNNDGGQGNIEIEIPSGKYVIDVGINYTDTKDYTHNGTLTDE